MPRRIYKPEEIIAKLRQVKVLTSQGKLAIDSIRSYPVYRTTSGHTEDYEKGRRRHCLRPISHSATERC
jgi:hypothetical protein